MKRRYLRERQKKKKNKEIPSLITVDETQSKPLELFRSPSNP
jgi:hypothetical protein